VEELTGENIAEMHGGAMLAAKLAFWGKGRSGRRLHDDQLNN
jgi:hypothetical protein